MCTNICTSMASPWLGDWISEVPAWNHLLEGWNQRVLVDISYTGRTWSSWYPWFINPFQNSKFFLDFWISEFSHFFRIFSNFSVFDFFYIFFRISICLIFSRIFSDFSVFSECSVFNFFFPKNFPDFFLFFPFIFFQFLSIF